MKKYSQLKDKSKYLTNFGFRFLLLCILLTSHLPKISAEDGPKSVGRRWHNAASIHVRHLQSDKCIVGNFI